MLIWALAPWQELVLLTKSEGKLDQAPLHQILQEFSGGDVSLDEIMPDETAVKWHVFFCSGMYHETGLMGGRLNSRWKDVLKFGHVMAFLNLEKCEKKNMAKLHGRIITEENLTKLSMTLSVES